MSRIQKLQEKLNATLDNIDELANKVESEERDFDADEQGTYDTLKSDVETINGQIAREKEIEELAKSRALPISPTPEEVKHYGSGARSTEKKLKAKLFVDMARAIYRGGGSSWNAIQYAESSGMKEASAVMKAAVDPATTTGVGWAAELVREGYTEFLDLLRPMSVYARMPGVSALLGRNGKLIVPGMTSGAGGSWVGEGAPIVVKPMVFNRQEMAPYKLGIITVQTREIMERSDPSSDTLIRDAMVKDTAEVIDATFVSDDAASAGVSPAGVRNGAGTVDATPAGALNTIEEIDAKMSEAIGVCLGANMDTSLVWLMNPLTILQLRMRSTATGVYPYRDQLDAGTYLGYPVLSSNTIPATNIVLVHSGSLFKLSEGSITMSMSTEAALQMDTAPANPMAAGTATSLWQTDSVGLRLIMPASWGVMRDKTKAVQDISGFVLV